MAISLLMVWLAPPLEGIGHAFVTLQSRSINILSSVGGATTVHTFSFTFDVPVDVASLQFQYCTDPISDVTCVGPNGGDVSGAQLDSQSGETGFTVLSTSTNQIILTRSLATAGTQLNTYQFSNVINPTDIGPFFVRISAYTSIDASGNYDAFSSVAASINTGVNVSAEVPQILYFCSAVSIPTDCSDATGDFIDLGVLTPNDVSLGTSQFLIGTNAPNGYAVTANGPTMTSGTDQIDAMATTGPSQIGKNQFGLNLRANLSPLIGADQAGGSGFVMPAYNTPDQFHYANGDVVAMGTGGTDIEIFTVSYVINIKSSQPPGIYDTTITYVCTAGF